MLKEIKSEKDVITGADLFNEIIKTVKMAEKWPDIIDYALAESVEGIYNYQFDPHFTLCPGSCEGVYLDLAIYGDWKLEAGKNEVLRLGTIKTLEEGDDAIRTMGILYAECLIAYNKIMSENLDAFTRRGFDMRFAHSALRVCDIQNEEAARDWLRKYNCESNAAYREPSLRNNLTRQTKCLYQEQNKTEKTYKEV